MINTDVQIEVEAAKMAAADLIAEHMDAAGITRSELARRLDVTRAHIAQTLSGERNISLETLVKFLYALELRVEFSVAPLKEAPEMTP